MLALFALLAALLMMARSLTMGQETSEPALERGDIASCIYASPNKLSFILESDGGNTFEIFLVENSAQNCSNPDFPSIEIQTTAAHNAWVHIVYTDAEEEKWQAFIDAEDKDRVGSPYPFYTYEQIFYDAPLWTYSVEYRPLSFWRGHAFAVNVNHHTKSIDCLGGIAWGFELSACNFSPRATKPQILLESDWIEAWQILQEGIPEYKQTYRGGRL
jgi:hypothetical protein